MAAVVSPGYGRATVNDPWEPPMSRISFLVTAALALALAAPSFAFASGNVVVSQLFGGGGNGGAPYRNDYVELFNRGSTAVDVTGWSVQYATATGTTWQRTVLSGSIAPGKYYLVQEGST